MPNPVLVELTRGPLVESRHAGAIAVVGADGRVLAAVGDIEAPVFPRSAIKPLQAIPFVESGAIEHFGFGTAEIALSCGSHSGTAAHGALAEAMLRRSGLASVALACGVQEPLDPEFARELIRSGRMPTALNHNCSGKHAGMLATAVHAGETVADYWRPEHPVQLRIAGALQDLAGCRLGADVCGIDGCSVPNWAIPLSGLARAFARLAGGEGLARSRALACRRIAEACMAHPGLVAGPGRLDTAVMSRLPGKVLTKGGAEGACCGALPEHGLGFAIKIDDGAKRAAEAVVRELLGRFYVEARDVGPSATRVNWRGLEVGRVQATRSLLDALGTLTAARVG
jgi:L-asparaginase II